MSGAATENRDRQGQRTTAAAVSGVGVARVAVARGAANGAALIEPQKVLPYVAWLRAILAVATPALVLWRRALARVVAKLSTLPLRQVSVDGVARDWVEHLHVCHHHASEKDLHKRRGAHHRSRHLHHAHGVYCVLWMGSVWGSI